MSRLTTVARRLRRNQTAAEEMLWQALRGRRLDGLKFRRQMEIAGHVADFACADLRLTIELDGAHHAEQVENDMRRRDAIEAAGWLEIRFPNDDVMQRPDWVLREILRMADIARGRPIREAFPRRD
ncbi:MAG: endonuclease domain-containing protein [Methylobacteriaceae bacterium]|nr:endonuclease domain-containing protein [Methylobacteriaceae bacterium]